jgi:hypothetical protein
VIALQASLGAVSRQQDWTLWRLPWWSWLLLVVPEALLLVPLAFSQSRRRLEQIGQRRAVALGLFGVMSVGNGLALLALIVSLLEGEETSGAELLFKGGTIWGTNVIAFGLWFWAFDGGGPVRRREPDPRRPDFQFPQMKDPQLAAPGWHTRLVDYVYVSFMNSVAFSPTD